MDPFYCHEAQYTSHCIPSQSQDIPSRIYHLKPFCNTLIGVIQSQVYVVTIYAVPSPLNIMDIQQLIHHYSFHCAKCMKYFKTQGSLVRHKRNVHSSLKLPCQYCHKPIKAISRPDAIQAHLKRCKIFNK
eukprot:NODE_677_length_4824_cov_0.791323.p6 type:complete len:130 gc:universal NODE_677_length_4824_cov_0.791323:1657-1268(-)